MFRALALSCLLVVTAFAQSPDPTAAPLQDDKKEERKDAPIIYSPQPGDTIGSTLTVSGKSACSPVMLMLTPPGTSYVEVTPDASGVWTHTFHGISGSVSVTACCKSNTHPTPPHGPCENVTNLVYSSTPPIGGLTTTAEARVLRSGIPTYKPGRVVLKGDYLRIPELKQSVHVFLEHADLKIPETHRSKVETAKLSVVDDKGVWTAEFTGVARGVYVARALVVSRGAKTETTSWVIKVEP